MLDTVFPRVRGDVGNATTWPFPVRYKVLEGVSPAKVMGKAPDADTLEHFIAGARQLEAEGVLAITTSCGFLAAFQRELADAVSIPMLTSALLQVPLVSNLIGPDSSVGILTERPHLNSTHFEAVGWSPDDIPIRLGALAPGAVFPTVFIDGGDSADLDVLEAEVVDAAVELCRASPDVGAIVLECTNFVPFSQAIRSATDLPVFDLYTLVMQVHEATSGRDFSQ